MTEPASLDVLGRLLPSMALIVGALLLVRRWSRRGVATRAGHGLRVVARTGLTRGAVLAVVAVGGRRFLVGAGDHGVTLLGELDERELDGADPGGDLATSAAGVIPPAASMTAASPLRAMDGRDLSTNRPRMGLVDRLRALTVRTHLERPFRATPG